MRRYNCTWDFNSCAKLEESQTGKLVLYEEAQAEIERLENLLMVYADPTEMSDDDAKLMSEIYQRFEKRQ